MSMTIDKVESRILDLSIEGYSPELSQEDDNSFIVSPDRKEKEWKMSSSKKNMEWNLE
jgi:hypothetical protein